MASSRFRRPIVLCLPWHLEGITPSATDYLRAYRRELWGTQRFSTSTIARRLGLTPSRLRRYRRVHRGLDAWVNACINAELSIGLTDAMTSRIVKTFLGEPVLKASKSMLANNWGLREFIDLLTEVKAAALEAQSKRPAARSSKTAVH